MNIKAAKDKLERCFEQSYNLFVALSALLVSKYNVALKNTRLNSLIAAPFPIVFLTVLEIRALVFSIPEQIMKYVVLQFASGTL